MMCFVTQLIKSAPYGPALLTGRGQAHTPYLCGGLDDRVWAMPTRGKSGLFEATVPGNPRAEQSDGKRHRKQTTPHGRGQGEKVG